MKQLKSTLIILTLLGLLVSCNKYIGYGVVMLPEDGSDLETGSLIKITKESRIRETWVYDTPEEEHIEIKKWRVEFYENLEDADSYIKEFEIYKNYYVVVNRSSHIMRIKPHPDAKQVYRLKKDQQVKVIGRGAEKEQHGRFEGYWWQLITSDGVVGWSFDSWLSVYDGDEVIHSNITPDGPEIHDFFKHTWRPRYYWEMQKSRNIDLEKFQAKFKMVPDLDNREVTISMPDLYKTYKFTEFKKTGTNNYNLEGSTVQLDFSVNGMVIVIYTDGIKSFEEDFIKMPDTTVNDIINTEISSRKIRYSEFSLNGPKYTSRVYGNIEFLTDNKFIWTNKNNLLTKQLITTNAGDSGTVSFKYFLGKALRGVYDGVITMDFGARQELTFLYNFDDSGVRFLYVPNSAIEEKVVESDDFFDPVILYFTGAF